MEGEREFDFCPECARGRIFRDRERDHGRDPSQACAVLVRAMACSCSRFWRASRAGRHARPSHDPILRCARAPSAARLLVVGCVPGAALASMAVFVCVPPVRAPSLGPRGGTQP